MGSLSLDEEVVKVKDLTYTYPGNTSPTLNNLHFKVKKGEFILICGPSGCGKSTLCKCLVGLIPNFYGGKFEGKVEVAGFDVTKHPVREIAQHVGFIGQNPEAQLFSFTVEGEVAFGVTNLGLPLEEVRCRVDWVLNLLNLKDLSERSVKELSSGEKQKVVLACTLAMTPSILVLDEPTSLLDPFSARSLISTLVESSRKLKITVIIVEHKLNLLLSYVDRVLVMSKDGKIIADGNPRKIFSSKSFVSTGLNIPKTIKLHQELVEEGLLSYPVSLTVEELASRLRRIFID
ncbi:MAG: energy-coupling factor ABC transporter ATP-binding protein [Candidatus Bathyarchaeota archaeon]|nr:energy-coupling factor ABC transporter ATP-binding protein [Candidatus Bathyarchaeota archaeon]